MAYFPFHGDDADIRRCGWKKTVSPFQTNSIARNTAQSRPFRPHMDQTGTFKRKNAFQRVTISKIEETGDCIDD
jgi:hypothetical protein